MNNEAAKMQCAFCCSKSVERASFSPISAQPCSLASFAKNEPILFLSQFPAHVPISFFPSISSITYQNVTMSVVWLASCFNDGCSKYGKVLTGCSPAQRPLCPTCQGGLEYEQSSGGSAMHAAPINPKKRRHENVDHEGNVGNIDGKKPKSRDGRSQTQSSNISTPGKGKAVPVSSGASPPYDGVVCELVKAPEEPSLEKAVYCVHHHSTSHQTCGCGLTYVLPVPEAYVKLHWEEGMTQEWVESTFKARELPSTMAEAMVHISALKNLCKDAKTFIEKRDMLFIQIRKGVVKYMSEPVVVFWDRLINIVCVKTKYVFDIIMWFVARLQKETVEAPLANAMASSGVPSSDGTYSHKELAKYAADRGDAALLPRLVHFTEMVKELSEFVRIYDDELGLFLDVARIIRRYRDNFSQGEVLQLYYTIPVEILPLTPEHLTEHPHLGLHLFKLRDVEKRRKLLFKKYSEFLKAQKAA